MGGGWAAGTWPGSMEYTPSTGLAGLAVQWFGRSGSLDGYKNVYVYIVLTCFRGFPWSSGPPGRFPLVPVPSVFPRSLPGRELKI